MPAFSNARLVISKEIQTTLQPLIDKARAANLPIYLVGGCVRDLILRKPILDIDVVVEGNISKISKTLGTAYKSKVVHHPAFLTYTLELKNGKHLDIATARKESYPEPSMLPVVEPASLLEDLYRRDFSINAIAASLNERDFGHLWDPYDGLVDLKGKRLRVLHEESFKDDATRIFRAARFASRFGCELDWRTRDWLREAVQAQYPVRLSGARLREELIPIFREPDPSKALALLSDWEALSYFVPGISWESGHVLLTQKLLKGFKKGDSTLRGLLALLHQQSIPKAKGSLAHMMFSNKVIDQVEQALILLQEVKSNQFSLKHIPEKHLKRVGPDVLDFLKQAAEMRSKVFRKKVEEEFQRYEASTPCLSGEDLSNLGYKPGPVFSKILKELREARWEGKVRTRQEEISFVLSRFPLK